MPIDPKDFVRSCVFHGLYLGVNPYYLAALALVRSNVDDVAKLSEGPNGSAIGPFQITQNLKQFFIVGSKDK